MEKRKQKYIFYCSNHNALNLRSLSLKNDYSFELWKPQIDKITPKNLFFKSLIVWWVFYYFRIFRSYDYRIFIIYFKNKEVAHYSVVLPKFFRTPFMKNDDLQIGPIGTNEKHRRKGLNSYAIAQIFEFFRGRDINFWYIVREENKISREFIEKIGFIKYGEGIKKKRFGFGLFDTFIIEKKY